MNKVIENLVEAQNYAINNRPKIGGFPFLAETLRLAGIKRNIWHLPSCQSLYLTKYGSVINQGIPLVAGMVEVPKFDRDSLIHALRTDQAGKSTFSEFLQAAWNAGIVKYDVDFTARKVIYYGANGEEYFEEYPLVEVKG
jgi:uncharacterized protein YbcV (DUF1398 family)